MPPIAYVAGGRGDGIALRDQVGHALGNGGLRLAVLQADIRTIRLDGVQRLPGAHPVLEDSQRDVVPRGIATVRIVLLQHKRDRLGVGLAASGKVDDLFWRRLHIMHAGVPRVPLRLAWHEIAHDVAVGTVGAVTVKCAADIEI